MVKILIVEDDPTAQKVIVKYVERMGHIPLVSPNGKNAYELLCAYNNFSILITDIMMPVMDGKELIRLVRNNLSLSHLPIIANSAFIPISEISSILEIGATFFLAKPINKKDFEEYVNNCIDIK